MSEAVEVLVFEHSKNAVKKQLGVLPHVRVVSRASGQDVARLLFPSLNDLGKHTTEFQRWLDHTWREHAAIPLVFLGPGGGKSVSCSLALLQALALVSKRTTSKAIDPYVAPDREAARRLVLAHSRQAENELIASASLEGDTLYVWSCEPRLYECAVANLPALARLSKRAREFSGQQREPAQLARRRHRHQSRHGPCARRSGIPEAGRVGVSTRGVAVRGSDAGRP
jgi:hypothetical protein